jgi:hypothetical protein
MMKRTSLILTLLIGMAVAAPTFADSRTNELAACLTDNLSGKERKSLAKWIFFAIGTHPEIKSYSNATEKDIKDDDEYVGQLITRLLTVDCPAPLKAAYSTDPMAIQKAFEVVGKVAMQELVTNQNVTKALTGYAQFADMVKISKVLNGK